MAAEQAVLAATPIIVTAGVACVRESALVTDISDEKLFLLAGGGDRDALEQLVRRYEKPLFGLLVRLTNGDQHRADDFFQETFLRAIRAAGTFKTQKQFKPWLIAIAVNLARDDARKRKTRSEVALDGGKETEDGRQLRELVADGDNPVDNVVRRDEAQQVQKALEGLTDLEHEVVLLHFYNSMTLSETAEALSVPLGTVKSRLHAALTRLSVLLRNLKT
ncbi:MAG: sigma-70 family RNA polymerase sigma factor [Planctomycetota bacterium]